MKKNNDISQHNRDEERLSGLIALSTIAFFIINARLFFERILFNLVSADTIALAIKIIYILYFITIIPIIFRRFSLKILVSFIFILVIFILNYFLFPENNAYFKNTVFDFVTLCLPPMIVFSIINDYSVLKDKLILAARTICVMATLFLIVLGNISTMDITNKYYQLGLGYSMLLPILLLLWESFANKKKKDVILVILAIVFLVLRASRGPLLAIGFFLAYFPIKKLIIGKNYLKALALFVLITIVILNIGNLIDSIAQVSKDMGFQSRTITLLSTDVTHDSGRTILYQTLTHEIEKDPLQIRGINSDYNILGIYSHNLFLELIYEFGVVIGGLLSLFIIVLFVRTLLVRDNDDESVIKIIFMLSGISCLLVSGTLWTKYEFWSWISMQKLPRRANRRLKEKE